jgi:hypothetical protein
VRVAGMDRGHHGGVGDQSKGEHLAGSGDVHLRVRCLDCCCQLAVMKIGLDKVGIGLMVGSALLRPLAAHVKPGTTK